MGANDRELDKKREAAAKRKAKTAEKASWVGFADVELTQVDKAALKAMGDMDGEAWETVLELVETGYKMSLSYDELHTTYNLSLTCNDSQNQNAGLTLTGRGGSLRAATLSLWYKHTQMLKGDWTSARSMQKGKMNADDMG